MWILSLAGSVSIEPPANIYENTYEYVYDLSTEKESIDARLMNPGFMPVYSRTVRLRGGASGGASGRGGRVSSWRFHVRSSHCPMKPVRSWMVTSTGRPPIRNVAF